MSKAQTSVSDETLDALSSSAYYCAFLDYVEAAANGTPRNPQFEAVLMENIVKAVREFRPKY